MRWGSEGRCEAWSQNRRSAEARPCPLSLFKSISQSMCLHYYSISPLLAKITLRRQIVSYNRPEWYHVKNWSIRPQMLFDSALCVNATTKDSFWWFIDGLWRKCLRPVQIESLQYQTLIYDIDNFQTLTDIMSLNFAFLHVQYAFSQTDDQYGLPSV